MFHQRSMAQSAAIERTQSPSAARSAGVGRRNEQNSSVPEAETENVVGRPVNMRIDTTGGSARNSPLAGDVAPAPMPLPISDADILLMERVSRAVQDQLLLRYQVRAT